LPDSALPSPARALRWLPSGIGKRLARAAAYSLGFAIPVTAIAFLVRSRWEPILHLDEAAIRAATDFSRQRPGLVRALLVWEEIWQPKWVYIVGTLVCLWVWRRHGLKSRALWAFTTMMVAWNVALDIKYLVQRTRPVVEDAITHAPGYSFPSGHAANAAAATTIVVILVWPLLGRTGRYAAVALAVVCTVVTCVDRVMLGVHYPSDVTAGVILGSGLGLASYAGFLGWKPTPPGVPSTVPDPTTRPEA